MDLQRIIDTAKELILERGDHPPVIFVENTHQDVTPCIVEFVGNTDFTTRQKQYSLFGVGREYGIEHPGSKVDTVVLVSEAWLSITVGEKKPKYDRARDDPGKKEVLMIMYLDTKTGKSTQSIVEMLRDGSGELMDLLRMPLHGEIEVHDHLLPYFVAGTASASMSDAELARHLTGH